ncbi:MAG: patatin-like phospholipase family protein [Firmicutes bacterium]|jgi:NTE family protein|nr:patatin-like phospholipase family protein [Bacillota bacterium]
MGASSQQGVGLALGGGVLRGLAHIGVLRAIREAGIRIDCLAGTSSGAVIGACYAAGISPESMEEIASRAQWRNLAEVSIRRDGLISTKRLAAYLDSIIGGATFDDLGPKFAVVACDIATGDEVVISTGRVSEAVRASCAIPGIFVPVRHGGRVLVDGGLCNNVPASVVRRLGADFVIAVDVNAAVLAEAPPPRNVFQVIVQAIHVLQQGNVSREVAHADLLIRPALSGLSPVEFAHARDFIDRGYRAAREALAGLRPGGPAGRPR